MGQGFPKVQPDVGGPDENIPTPGSTDSGVPLVEGGNPAWNDVLQYIPEDKRTEVVPRLQEWDKSYQQVQQQTAPWKEFIEGGVEPETAKMALNVLNVIENNPQQAYEIIGKHIGITPGQAQQIVEEYQEGTEEVPPSVSAEQFDELKRTTDTMAQLMLARRHEEEVAEQEQQLDQELSDLKKNHGDFPEDEIVMRMLQKDLSAEDALKDYSEFEENLFKNRRSAPRVFSGGGQIPTPKVDPTKLDGKGTRELVAQMLIDSAQQGG